MVRVQVGGGVTNKSIIMLECGLHAREWIAPASCIWIFSQVSRISLFWQLFNCLTNLTILLTAGQRVRKQCRNHGPAQFLWLAHRSMRQSWRLWIHVEHGNHLSYYSYRLMVWSSKIERFPAWKPTFLWVLAVFWENGYSNSIRLMTLNRSLGQMCNVLEYLNSSRLSGSVIGCIAFTVLRIYWMAQ